jgi:GTP-binding protein
MIIGLNNKDNELNVNPIKTKQLTNVRASGKDDSILLTSPIQITLEKAIEQIGNDDLIEITPKVIRLRKKTLLQNMRKRAS